MNAPTGYSSSVKRQLAAVDVDPALGDGIRFGEDGWVFGRASYDDYRAAAVQAGAAPLDAEPPSVEAALERFGRMATPEVSAVCDLPEVRAEAELWRLAGEWRVRPVRVLSGRLWERA